MLPFYLFIIAPCRLGGVSLHMTKRLCSKSAHIVEFSQGFSGHGLICLYVTYLNPKKLCLNLRFPSSVIATSFGLSRCLLLVINLNLQSESLAQEQNSESGGPGHRHLKASWPWLGNKTVSPTCSKLRMDSNIYSQPPAHAPCSWKMYLNW